MTESPLGIDRPGPKLTAESQPNGQGKRDPHPSRRRRKVLAALAGGGGPRPPAAPPPPPLRAAAAKSSRHWRADSSSASVQRPPSPHGTTLNSQTARSAREVTSISREARTEARHGPAAPPPPEKHSASQPTPTIWCPVNLPTLRLRCGFHPAPSPLPPEYWRVS